MAYVLSRVDYHIFKESKVLLAIMGVTVVLLVSVLFIREVRLGAVRTLFQGSSPAVGTGKNGDRRLPCRSGFVQSGNHCMTSIWG